MTETTATRLAAAIEQARTKVRDSVVDYGTVAASSNPDNDDAVCDAIDAALTRLEKLCAASGRIEQHDCDSVISYRTCVSHCELAAEIEALLREET